MSKFARSDERYWLDRVEFWQRRSKGGSIVQDKTYSVRLYHKPRREIFQLYTANKKIAAKKARDIYLHLKANGWDATLDKFKTKEAEVVTSPTIGDIIRVFLAHTKVSSSTANGYANSLRTIVAGIAGIDRDKSRFDYVNGGTAQWRADIDAVELSTITGSAVDKWAIDYVEERSANDYRKKRSAEISANSYITYSRSIFGKKIIAVMREQLELPEVIPFDEATKFTVPKKKYSSKIDIEKLIGKAYDELPGIEQDQQWLIFLLAVSAGLRRDEIDKLTWEQIDTDGHTIDLSETKYFKPKGTLGNVSIDPELSEMIAKYQDDSPSEFVIQSDIKPRFNTKGRHYRAEPHHKKLLLWLRANGITSRKPMHDLRKEAGSRIYEKYGLMAASKFLRHGDVSTTADYYVDTSKDVTTGFGGLFTGKKSK